MQKYLLKTGTSNHRSHLLTVATLAATAFLSTSTHIEAAPLPLISPAVNQWNPAQGTLKVDSSKWSYNKAASAVASVIKSELKSTNVKLAQKPQPGTIHLELDVDKTAKEGSYEIHIGESVVIRSSSTAGLYYGTRTLLQLLTSSTELPTGVIKDSPKYERRGLLLDVGRKFATVDEVKDWIRLMGWFKMNELHFHINDNSWGRYPGYRLESKKFPGLSSSDGFYTWKEIRELQDFAQVRGVTIVPEIDAPGHSLAFTMYKPELAHPEIDRHGFGCAYLDVSNPDAIRFMEQLIDEVAPHFDSKEFHIGTDEYRINLIKNPAKRKEAGELFRKWINHFANHIEKNHNKVPRIWSGFEHLPGTTLPKKSIVIDMWETSDAKSKSKAGYQFVNSSHFFTYIVPGAPYYGVNNSYIYEKWTPLIFANKKGAILDESDPGLLGGKLHIWNDFGPTGYTWNEIARLTAPSMASFGQAFWGSPNTNNFANLQTALPRLIKGIPTTPLLQRNSATDGKPVVNITNEREYIANTSVPILSQSGKPMADLEWPWRADFTITRKTDCKGDEVLIGSDLATFYLDLTHETTVKKKKISKRGVACVRANQAPGFSPITSNRPDVLQFDYQVPLNKKVKLSFRGDRRKTSLYVDGKLIQSIAKQMLCPLAKIGAQSLPDGFHGTLHKVEINSFLPQKSTLAKWAPASFKTAKLQLALKVPKNTSYVSFSYTNGLNGVDISNVQLRNGSTVVHSFKQTGFAGGKPKDNIFEIPNKLSTKDNLTLHATLNGAGGSDSSGTIEATSK